MGKMDTPQNLVEWSSKAVKRLKSKGEERIISDASQDSLMNVHQLRECYQVVEDEQLCMIF
jgi:hypothetical protein